MVIAAAEVAHPPGLLHALLLDDDGHLAGTGIVALLGGGHVGVGQHVFQGGPHFLGLGLVGGHNLVGVGKLQLQFALALLGGFGLGRIGRFCRLRVRIRQPRERLLPRELS